MKISNKNKEIHIKSEEEKEIEKCHRWVTSQGHIIVKIYVDESEDDRLYVIVYRRKRKDFAVGAGYSLMTGNWAAGLAYDVLTLERAQEILLEKGLTNLKDITD